jgi:nitrous oxide reductase accessory protein NosL
MRKVLLLALVALFLGAACSKSEETAPAAPEASASAEASPAAAPSPGGDMGSPAASPAAP